MADISEFRTRVGRKFPYGVRITFEDLDIPSLIDGFSEDGDKPVLLTINQAKDLRVVVAVLQERGDRWVVTDDRGREIVMVPLTKEQGAILSDVLANQP